jgi:hypothetical protein
MGQDEGPSERLLLWTVYMLLVVAGVVALMEAYRFRRQLYYATCAILVSIPSSYSEGVRYPSPF